MVGAQVHAEKMPGRRGPDGAVEGLALRVETRGLVIVSVNGVNLPVVELGALGIRIGDLPRHGGCEQAVERSDVLEPARALERLEEMARLDVGDILVGVILEEFLPGDGAAQAAQHAELAIVDVGDSGAVVLTHRSGVEADNVGEENTGELGIQLLR